jgi:hypothetical protein
VATSILTPWSNFYIMIGSSAATLTGLMFVVITLVKDVQRSDVAENGIPTFSTPTVVHFGAALLVSAILSAPWRSLDYPGALLGAASQCRLAYLLRVTYLTKRLTSYTPDLEDWIWYTILPFVADAAILSGAILLFVIPAEALFALAAGTTLLIFIGIRNAWDVVTFIALGKLNPPDKSD